MAKTTKLGARFLPWSISRLKDFERCPLYAYEVHVLRHRDQKPSPAAERGTRIHGEAEAYVKADRAPRTLAPELAPHKARLQELRRATARFTELKFGLTSMWEPCGFSAPETWARGAYDVVALTAEGVRVVDHKTGRRYPEHLDQLRFYAVAALAWQPKAPRVVAEAWYIDEPPSAPALRHELTRDCLVLEMAHFEERAARMSTLRKIVATPNTRCRWCHLNKDNGGTCEEGAR